MKARLSIFSMMIIFIWCPARPALCAESNPPQDESDEGDGRITSSASDSEVKSKDSLRSKARGILNQTTEALGDAEKKLTGDLSSRDWRREKRFAVLGNYATYDLFIPGKKGASLVLMESDDKCWELEYLKAELDVPFVIRNLGSIQETRISLMKRGFWDTNSFSGYFGLSFNSISMTLGDELLSKLTNGAVPSSKLLALDSIGFNTGVGSRWTIWKGVTYGADWIGLSQPLITIRRESSILDNAANQSEKDRIDKSLKLATYFPRIYLLKIQLGLMF